MRMLTVPDSSNVAAIGYDLSAGTLRVQFKGGREHDYKGVTPLEFAQLASADSLGAWFARNVRDVHPNTRVPPHEAGAMSPTEGLFWADVGPSLAVEPHNPNPGVLSLVRLAPEPLD